MGNKSIKPVLTDQDLTDFIKSSGLDEVKVREAYKIFMSNHPNGTIERADFGQMVKTAYPIRSVDTAKMEKCLFRMYDANNDGVIDFTEFMAIYNIMDAGTPEEVLGKIFNVFDTNHDGKIRKKELDKMVKDLYPLIKQDNPDCAPIEDIVKTVFAEMGKDTNEEITKEEFEKACLERKNTTKKLAIIFINIFVEEDKNHTDHDVPKKGLLNITKEFYLDNGSKDRQPNMIICVSFNNPFAGKPQRQRKLLTSRRILGDFFITSMINVNDHQHSSFNLSA